MPPHYPSIIHAEIPILLSQPDLRTYSHTLPVKYGLRNRLYISLFFTFGNIYVFPRFDLVIPR